MLKEIYEQPKAVRDTLSGRLDKDGKGVTRVLNGKQTQGEAKSSGSAAEKFLNSFKKRNGGKS